MERRGVSVKVSFELLRELLGLDNSKEIFFTCQQDPYTVTLFIRGDDLPVVPEGAVYPEATIQIERNKSRIVPLNSKGQVFIDSEQGR